jgi:NADPH2:quinone reductase
MKAVICTTFGGPDHLEVGALPDPQRDPQRAIVAVKAVGLNFFDLLQIAGKYQVKPPLPFAIGAEFSGVIEDIGTDVTGFARGDRVLGWVEHGAAAERVSALPSTLVKIHDGLGFDRAAALGVTYGTSYYALKDRARLAPGETLAVLGASGGVGLAAVELGKLMGARVIAAASTDEKLALCKKYGADEVINYTKEDLRERMKALTGGKGVDVVYDPVGGNLAEPAIRGLAPGGRFLVIGFAAGEIPKIPINLVLIKRSAIVGVFYGNWVLANEAKARANFKELTDWYAQGKLKPHISKHFPMTEAADAISHVANRKVEGKVVIEIAK